MAQTDGAEAEEAWNILLERYREPIRKQIAKHFRNDAEDLVAEFIDLVFAHKLIPVADRQQGRFRASGLCPRCRLNPAAEDAGGPRPAADPLPAVARTEFLPPVWADYGEVFVIDLGSGCVTQPGSTGQSEGGQPLNLDTDRAALLREDPSSPLSTQRDGMPVTFAYAPPEAWATPASPVTPQADEWFHH